MAIELHVAEDGTTELLYFHFDVPNHFVRLETFINTATQAKIIVEAFDAPFFNGGLEYELVVVPPATCTFLTKLAIVFGLPGSVFEFANSTVGSAYIEGFTGEPTSHWAKLAGVKSAEHSKI